MEIRLTSDRNAVITISVLTLLMVLYMWFQYYLLSTRIIAMRQFGIDPLSDEYEEKKPKTIEIKEKRTVDQTKTEQPKDFPKVKRKYRKRKK